MNQNCQIALAGLLSGIGDFAERAVWRPQERESYAELALDEILQYLPSSSITEGGQAAEEAPNNALARLALSQENSDVLLHWIVNAARKAAYGQSQDRFSASNLHETAERTPNLSPYTTRLNCLFEQINSADSNSDKKEPKTLQYRYSLSPYNLASMFPVDAKSTESKSDFMGHRQYVDLWNSFKSSCELIPKSHQEILPLWLDSFNSLLMTFAHAVPSKSNNGIQTNTSLYDHSRVVAALTVALWNFHKSRQSNEEAEIRTLKQGADWNEDKFLFIQGDLSGIQNFIFTTGGKSTKYAAKLLRGRSFYVSLLSECAALRILEELDLPPTSQVLNAAGKFTIVAPNSEATVSKLLALRKVFDEWFLKFTYGQTGIGIAWTAASCADLEKGEGDDSLFRKLLRKLFGELDETKFQKFNLCGENSPDPIINPDYLSAYRKYGLCEIDGHLPADHRPGRGNSSDPKISLSQLAEDHLRIGEIIVRKQGVSRIYISKRKLRSSNLEHLNLDLFGFWAAFAKTETNLELSGEILDKEELLRVWDFSLPSDSTKSLFNGFARRNVNGWVPSDDNGVKDFESIADASEGIKALMTLKGDVDNLGAIFQQSLKFCSLTDWTALSRQMDAFFTVYLPSLCQTRYENSYTVFAGGDDFMLIGPWAQQMRLADRMRKEFARYVANNSAISYSAGLAMTKPNIPIQFLASLSEEAVKMSKSQKTEDSEKNAVTCFGQTVDWNSFSAMLQSQERIQQLAAEGVLSKSYFYGLLQFAEMEEGLNSDAAHKSIRNALWRSQFYYRTSRLLEKKIKQPSERDNMLNRLVEEFIDKGIREYQGNYKIALHHHLYRLRNKE